MAVNHEVKGNLARLLATEDLVVEHKNCETAQFNVHTRVLTLPLWEKASGTVYDLLVGHEVGHALFTPDQEWNEITNIPRVFVNVVEDARIEKLMKRKYAGLNKTFYRGYQELYDQDFFSIGNDNIDEFNLADKVNLHFKIGSFIQFNFKEEEKEIVNQIANAETFSEVLDAAEKLYNYCKEEFEEEDIQEEFKVEYDELEENKDKQQNQEINNNSSEKQKENNNNEESIVQKALETKKVDDNIKSKKTNNFNNSRSEEKIQPEVKTMSSLESAIKELVEEKYQENIYVEIPKMNLEEVIISNEEVHEIFHQKWLENMAEMPDIFDEADKHYKDFKKSAQKEVNYLIKEFECKKSADFYARTTISKTGVLDCSKLHTFKYNEDLFKKVATFPNGKNHGLIFILDWSGSMSGVMLDTIKQLYNIIWFCKKTNIPFEVYAFNSEWNKRKVYNHRIRMYELINPIYEKKEGVFSIDDGFALFNFFSSKTNSAELERQMINVYRIALLFRYISMGRSGLDIHIHYSHPQEFSLSSTPLNETLVCLHQIIPQFKEQKKVQKVHCVILTDGEAHTLNRHVMINRRYDRDPYIGVVGINPYCTFLRDRKLGTTYSFKIDDYYQFSEVLLRNLRDKFPNVSFIGIRVLPNREVNHFIRRYVKDINYYAKLLEIWRKEKSFTLKTSGYHAYFGISSNSLFNDVEFQVQENATKTQIKSAFSKSLKSKKMNKKILNEFVGLIS